MKKIFLSFLIVCIISCSSDDGSEIVIDESALEDLRAESIEMLAGTDGRVWKIIQASLQNQQNTIDISSNFNVVDDEFIFTDTTIEWRQAHAIKYVATNADEAKQDYYVAPENYSYSFEPESATRFSSNAAMQYEIVHNDSISANFSVSNGTELQLLLVPKTMQDYASAENTSLQFTEAFTVNASLSVFGAGMIGANADQSIYLSHNGYYNNNFSERVVKIDLVNGTETEQIIPSYNYVYKKMHMMNNQVAVVNTQTVDLYDLNLSSSPVSSQAGGNFGQVLYGTATQGDDIYIVGGHATGDPREIYKFNVVTQTYTPFATLPEARYGADATIVNNTLYVFGGITDFPQVQPPQSTIYIIPLDDPSNIQTLQMNQNMNVTYVKSYQNLIYVAGITFTGNTVVGIENRESYIGVFNTLDNTYQELQHNLVDANGLKAIEEMCIVGNKMYLIYGDMLGEGPQDWSIYSATLD